MGSRWVRGGARLKRSLEVLVELEGEPVPPPQVLRAGDTRVTVMDAGDGSASRRLASCLVDAGATPLEVERETDAHLEQIRIVIRAAARTADARRRSTALEATADLILGSARPAFARRLVDGLLGDR